MEGQHYFDLDEDDMSVSLVEVVILGGTFAAVVVVVVRFIVVDLPDNFLTKSNVRLKRMKEEKHGRLRDHG